MTSEFEFEIGQKVSAYCVLAGDREPAEVLGLAGVHVKSPLHCYDGRYWMVRFVAGRWAGSRAWVTEDQIA